MPYYAGDYYLGDPGLLSWAKKGLKAVGGILKGPLGGVVAGLVPGGGILKAGFDLLGGGGRTSGGTPGHVAQAAEAARLVHHTARLRRYRTYRPRRLRRR